MTKNFFTDKFYSDVRCVTFTYLHQLLLNDKHMKVMEEINFYSEGINFSNNNVLQFYHQAEEDDMTQFTDLVIQELDVARFQDDNVEIDADTENLEYIRRQVLYSSEALDLFLRPRFIHDMIIYYRGVYSIRNRIKKYSNHEDMERFIGDCIDGLDEDDEKYPHYRELKLYLCADMKKDYINYLKKTPWGDYLD